MPLSRRRHGGVSGLLIALSRGGNPPTCPHGKHLPINGLQISPKTEAAVVAVRRGGGTHAFDTINHMFLMSGVIVPGSIYWNLGFGLEKGEVKKDKEGLRNMTDLGQTIAWLGKAIRQLEGSGDRIAECERNCCTARHWHPLRSRNRAA